LRVRTRAVEQSYRLPFHVGYPTFTGQAIPGGGPPAPGDPAGAGAPLCAQDEELCMHRQAIGRRAGSRRAGMTRPAGAGKRGSSAAAERWGEIIARPITVN
jgi:hypothetical protein